MKNNINNKYNESINMLIKYMKKTRIRPSEKKWNRYAVENGLLSSKTIGYISGKGFNKLCRNLILKNRM